MKITIYTITDCPFSKQEKDFLTAHNLQYEEKNLETNKELLTEMLVVSNNFAGTPVTKIEKNDGQIAVLKGFTEEEFATTLNLSTSPAIAPESHAEPITHNPEPSMSSMAVAAATMNAPAMPPEPKIEPPAPVSPPTPPPMPPLPQTPTEPTPQPPAAPATDPNTQEAAATMAVPTSPPPIPEPAAPPVPDPAPPAPANDKLNSILQNLQQKVDSIPSSAPANPTVTTSSTTPVTPTMPNIPEPDFH